MDEMPENSNEDQSEEYDPIEPGDDDLYGEDFTEVPEEETVATGDDKKETQSPSTDPLAVPQSDLNAHGTTTPADRDTTLAAKVEVLTDMLLKTQQQTQPKTVQSSPDTPKEQPKDYLATLEAGFAMTQEQSNEYQALLDELGPKIAEQQLKQWKIEHVQKALAYNQEVLMTQLLQKQQDEAQAHHEVLQKAIDDIPQLAAMQNDPAQWSFANQMHSTLMQTSAYASLPVQDQMMHLNNVLAASLASLAPKDKPPVPVTPATMPTEDQKKAVAAKVANLQQYVPKSMTSMGQGAPVVTEFDPNTASKAELQVHMDKLAKKGGNALEDFMAQFS
ncbi:MAG: hypothetical protein H7839_19980 [Magnetococcus sp. YQC-5]